MVAGRGCKVMLIVIQLLSAPRTHRIYHRHPDGTLTPSSFRANYTPEGAARIAGTMNSKHPLEGGVAYVAVERGKENDSANG